MCLFISYFLQKFTKEIHTQSIIFFFCYFNNEKWEEYIYLNEALNHSYSLDVKEMALIQAFYEQKLIVYNIRNFGACILFNYFFFCEF